MGQGAPGAKPAGAAFSGAAVLFLVVGLSGTCQADAPAAADPPAWLLFSGADIANDTAFFYAGARRSLSGGIDAPGFLLSAFSGAGTYRYDTQNVAGGRVEARFSLAEAQLGYQVGGPGYGIAAFAGLRVEDHDLTPVDPGNPVRGTKAGAAVTLDGWAKPFADTLVTLFASATTVFDGYYARAHAGYRLPLGDNLYAGPELALLGNSQYRQLRLGLHATGLAIGRLSLGLSGGVIEDRDNGTGVYGTLSAWGRL